MRFSQLLSLTWSNLKGKKTRTILTIAGISVGIGAIVFLVSLGYGFQTFTVNRISSINSLTSLNVSQGKAINIIIDSSAIEKIKKIENIEKVVPALTSGATVDYKNKKIDIVATATESSFLKDEDVKLATGKYFDDNSKQIVVSSALVKNTNEDNSSIISKEMELTINFKDKNGKYLSKKFNAKIVGVVEDETSAFAYYPISSISELLNENTIYSSLKVKVKSQQALDASKKEIEDLGFNVVSISDTIKQIDRIFRYIRIILGIFGGIALLVAAIGMFNTMTIALLERTRDIGIMKAVGVANKDVYLMFLLESIIISSLGGIFGNIGGSFLAYALNLFINYLAKIVKAEPVVLSRTPLWFLGLIFIFSIIVGITTGIYPSKRAANINPLDALRYE